MNSISPEKETARLAALERFGILDTLPEREFDDLTLLASTICQTPIALISLVDGERQWFKSKIGLTTDETPREYAFCAHAIEDEKIFTVSDASGDERFAANPLVAGEPHIRFYAGAPLLTEEGFALGTLCVIDRKPRELSAEQQRTLRALARNAMDKLEARRRNAELEAALERQTRLERAAPPENIKDADLPADARGKSRIRHSAMCYGLAVFAVAVAAFLKYLLDPFIGTESPFLLFFGAVLLAGWRGGLGAGLLATALAVLTIDWFFLTPQNWFFNQPAGQNIQLGLFLLEGSLAGFLCRAKLRYEAESRRSQAELETRVEERTGEIVETNTLLQQAVTENRRSATAALKIERRYRDLVDKSLGLICTHNLEGVLLSINPAAAAALSYAPEELVGKSIAVLMPPAKKFLTAISNG